jgi:hypothetical protein
LAAFLAEVIAVGGGANSIESAGIKAMAAKGRMPKVPTCQKSKPPKIGPRARPACPAKKKPDVAAPAWLLGAAAAAVAVPIGWKSPEPNEASTNRGRISDHEPAKATAIKKAVVQSTPMAPSATARPPTRSAHKPKKGWLIAPAKV